MKQKDTPYLLAMFMRVGKLFQYQLSSSRHTSTVLDYKPYGSKPAGLLGMLAWDDGNNNTLGGSETVEGSSIPCFQTARLARSWDKATGAHSIAWIRSYNCWSSDSAAMRLVRFSPQPHHVPLYQITQ